MHSGVVAALLEKIKKVRIAVFGDFCFDAYWVLDPAGSEISVETGLQAEAVRQQHYGLGGAGNIVANLVALQPAVIHAIGVIGDDLFGRELTRQLAALGVHTEGLVVQRDDFDTQTYCKRFLDGEEQARLDFGFFSRRTAGTARRLLQAIESVLDAVEVVILNQQIPGSLADPQFRRQLSALIAKRPDRIFLLDSRHHAGDFPNAYLKTNQYEAALLNGIEARPQDFFNPSDLERFARDLHRRCGKPVFISRGDRGLLATDGTNICSVPGIQILKKVDPVGAGDTTTSAIACALAAGAGLQDTITFANFAAAVTVQKIMQTGTASGEEILTIARSPDYVYQPELAEDIRQARYQNGTEIERCADQPVWQQVKIRHAVFDHDGTISTLRQGWEAVMQPVMLRAILGEAYERVEPRILQKIRQHVRQYIDRSTGIQTIVQMSDLVDMVREFNFVPKDRILDKFGYKQAYNEALMALVNQRIAKLKSGELATEDFAIKGALPFLRALRQRGITLYLASGTDIADVQKEARVMGYADLFDGGIYGAVGDISKYSKRKVIEKIIRSHRLQGPELIVFGDGPVEIRETRKAGGLAVGVASDEIRRHGLNDEKRTRLIKAGAHLLIPDFSQHAKLLCLLFGDRGGCRQKNGPAGDRK